MFYLNVSLAWAKLGTGQATKICNQLIVATNSTLIAEAVALGRSMQV